MMKPKVDTRLLQKSHDTNQTVAFLGGKSYEQGMASERSSRPTCNLRTSHPLSIQEPGAHSQATKNSNLLAQSLRVEDVVAMGGKPGPALAQHLGGDACYTALLPHQAFSEGGNYAPVQSHQMLNKDSSRAIALPLNESLSQLPQHILQTALASPSHLNSDAVRNSTARHNLPHTAIGRSANSSRTALQTQLALTAMMGRAPPETVMACDMTRLQDASGAAIAANEAYEAYATANPFNSKEMGELISLGDQDSERTAKDLSSQKQMPIDAPLASRFAQNESGMDQRAILDKPKGGRQVNRKASGRRQLAGKTLLQKTSHFTKDKKSWQIDQLTGQVIQVRKLVTDTGNFTTLKSSQTRPENQTIESPLNNNRFGSQNYIENQQFVRSATGYTSQMLDSGRPQRGNLRRNGEPPTVMDVGLIPNLPSTLQKNSHTNSGDHPNSINLLDSPSNLNQFAYKQEKLKIQIVESKKGADYVQQNNNQDLEPEITSQDNGRLSGTNLINRRYQTQKRVQSANANSFAVRNRQQQQRGGRNFTRTGGSSLFNGSSNQFIGAPIVDPSSSQFERRGTIDQSANLHLLEGRNFTVDFTSQANSTLQSSMRGPITNLNSRARRPKSGANKPYKTGQNLRTGTARNLHFNLRGGARAASQSPQSDGSENRHRGLKRFGSGGRQGTVQAYNQHKFAEQLLHEEEKIANEQELLMRQGQLLMSNLMQQVQAEPEQLLKRDNKTGATTGLSSDEIMQRLFGQQKYDQKQNIVLTKNPLIIRKEKVGNQHDFQAETAKAIIEILSTKSTAEQFSALGSANPFAMFMPGGIRSPDQPENVNLQNTAVGDIELQKDETKAALFNFLGKLQDYQTTHQNNYAFQPPDFGQAVAANKFAIQRHQRPESKPRLKAPITQSQVTQTLLNQSKKRRLWSSNGLKSSQFGPQKPSQGGLKASQKVKQQSKGASISYKEENKQQAQNCDQDTIGVILLRPEESDVLLDNQMATRYVSKDMNVLGTDRQSTLMPHAFYSDPATQEKIKESIKVSLTNDNDTAVMGNHSSHRQVHVDTNFKSRAEAEAHLNLDIVPSSQVQVQSIQIGRQSKKQAAIKDVERPREINMSLPIPEQARGLNPKQSSGLHVLSVANPAGNGNISHQNLRYEAGEDYNSRVANLGSQGDGGRDRLQHIRSKMKSSSSSSLKKIGSFHLQRKRCQSANAANRNKDQQVRRTLAAHKDSGSPSRHGKSGKVINNLASEMDIVVHGRNISQNTTNQLLNDNPSTSKGRNLSKSSLNRDIQQFPQSHASEPNALIVAPEPQTNMVNTINQGENDPRSPTTIADDLTPIGYRKDYLPFKLQGPNREQAPQLNQGQIITIKQTQMHPSTHKDVQDFSHEVKKKGSSESVTKPNLTLQTASQQMAQQRLGNRIANISARGGQQQRQRSSRKNSFEQVGTNHQSAEKRKAEVEQVNSDLIICQDQVNPPKKKTIHQKGGGLSSTEVVSRADGNISGTLSTIMEPNQQSKLTRGQQPSSLLKEDHLLGSQSSSLSKPRVSAATPGTAVRYHQPLANKDGSISILTGQHDLRRSQDTNELQNLTTQVVQGRQPPYKMPTALDLGSLVGRNNVDGKHSHDSTVQMELASSAGAKDLNSGGRGGDVDGDYQDTSGPSNSITLAHNKIISPDSLMGKVYQKQNKNPYQRVISRQQHVRTQQKSISPRGGLGSSNDSRSGGGPVVGLPLTDFNSKLTFNKDGGPKKQEREQGKHSRPTTPTIHQQRRMRNRSRYQGTQKAPTSGVRSDQNYTGSQNFENQSECVAHCQECNFNNWPDDPNRGIGNSQAIVLGSRVTNQNHFVISTIEKLQGQVDSQGMSILNLTGAQQRGSDTQFSPSERQRVFEQLQELPLELTQQLTATANFNQQQQAVLMAQEEEGGCVLDYRAVVAPQTATSQGQVKLIGHKSQHQRRKGLSLGAYPKNFSQAPNTLKGNQTTTNFGGFKRQPSAGRVGRKRSSALGVGVKASQGWTHRASNPITSPPLAIVNSQTMIMTKRRIHEAAAKHQTEHQSSNQASPIPSHGTTSQNQKGSRIRLGVSPHKGGTDATNTNIEIRSQDYQYTVDESGQKTATQHKLGRNTSLKKTQQLAVLNDQSLDLNDPQAQGVIHDLNSNRVFHMFGCRAGEDLASFHNDKSSVAQTLNQLTQRQATPTLANNINAQTVVAASPPQSDLLSLPDNRANALLDVTSSKTQVVDETVSSQPAFSSVNRGHQRRGIMSRQSSAMVKNQSPSSVTQLIDNNLIKGEDGLPLHERLVKRMSTDELGEVTRTEDRPSESGVPVGQQHSARSIIRGDINSDSLGSANLNALDANSDKQCSTSVQGAVNATERGGAFNNYSSPNVVSKVNSDLQVSRQFI